MATALQICAAAFNEANLDQDLTSFSMADFPYTTALDLLNKVIREMNREGRYWFTETATSLPYTPGVYQYNMTTLGIDPKSITRVGKVNTQGIQDLTPLNYPEMQRRYPFTSIQTVQPQFYSRYNNILYLNSIPDQDYQITAYHFRDMPLVTSESESLLCPEADEDVFQDGVYAYLMNRLGRENWQPAWAAYMQKVKSMVVKLENDLAMPTQMPAAF